MHKSETLPEMYSAEAFASQYSRRRCAEYFLRLCFFPAARRAALRGRDEVLVLSVRAGASTGYLSTLSDILTDLGWITFYARDDDNIQLFALIPSAK